MKEFPGFVVEKFRVHNINPAADHFSSTNDTYLVAFRDPVNKAGSHVVNVRLGGRYFYDPDAKTSQNAIDYGHKWIDIAVKIGSPTSASTCRYPRGRSRILDSPLKAWASWPNTALNGISSSIWRTIMQRRRIRFYSSQSLRK